MSTIPPAGILFSLVAAHAAAATGAVATPPTEPPRAEARPVGAVPPVVDGNVLGDPASALLLV